MRESCGRRVRRLGCALVAVTALALDASPVRGAPRLPAVISDGMVLQRDRALPIWGSADPGEAITVRIADARADTVTAADGRWRVTLPPLAAGGPFTLAVRGTTSLFVNDVLVGEVWLCAGQSNMRFPLGDADTAAEDVAAADRPDLRFFTVGRASALDPRIDAEGRWHQSTPETARAFSAVAYHFGVELQRHLGVPIGLLHASWSGSAGEEWLSRAALRSDPILHPILDRWEAVPWTQKAIYRARESIGLEIDDVALVAADGAALPLSDFDDARARTRLGGRWSLDATTAPGARFGLARAFESPGWFASLAGARGVEDLVLLRMTLQPWDHPFDLTRHSAIRLRARGRTPFRLRMLQPSITDFDDYASPPIRVTPDWQEVTVRLRDFAQDGWGRRHAFTQDTVSGFAFEVLPAEEAPRRPPAGIFHGMIMPLAPYALRGVLWYQGESNNGRAYQYRRLLPALVRSWRALWSDAPLPFGIVQLPGYGRPRAEPRGSRWAELREAQAIAAALPDTGLVVTLDLGDPEDVHPTRKAEVGRRAARWARAAVYGHDVVASGPQYDAMRVEGRHVRVRLRSGTALTTRDGAAPRGFAVAGSDRRFVWAEARLAADTVVTWSDEVPSPVAVRYGWSDSPDATLTDSEGLPAAPFRTDAWPGKTDDER